MDRRFEIMKMKEEKKKEALQKSYLKMIKENGLIIQTIPEEELTYEMCKEAILQNRKAYEYVPYTHKTYKLWLLSKTPQFLWK